MIGTRVGTLDELLKDLPAGFVLFRAPRPNGWKDGLDQCWIAAVTEYEDTMCCADYFIDEMFRISVSADTPAKAVARLVKRLNE